MRGHVILDTLFYVFLGIKKKIGLFSVVFSYLGKNRYRY